MNNEVLNNIHIHNNEVLTNIHVCNNEENENPIIWILNSIDIEEYDAPCGDSMRYKGKDISGIIRDVDVLNKNIKMFREGDYIMEKNIFNAIYTKSTEMWQIIKIFPNEGNNECKRMLITNLWKNIKINNYKIYDNN